MNWEVEFTDQAKQDLRDILDYITYELQEPQVAVNLVRSITKEILSLDQMPMRYRLYDEEPWQSQGLRCFPVKNYLIFYYPDETKSTVYAVRVIYGGRDISRQLSETETIRSVIVCSFFVLSFYMFSTIYETSM